MAWPKKKHKTEKDHFIKPSSFTDKEPKATEDLPPIMKKVSVRTQGSQVKFQCLSTGFPYYTLGGRNECKFCLFPNRNHFRHVDCNDVSMPGADIMKATCLLKRELKKEASKSLEGGFQCLPYAHPCVISTNSPGPLPLCFSGSCADPSRRVQPLFLLECGLCTRVDTRKP